MQITGVLKWSNAHEGLVLMVGDATWVMEDIFEGLEGKTVRVSIEVTQADGWHFQVPLDLMREGCMRFLIRGRQDPEEKAVAVKVVPADPKAPDQLARESAIYGMSWLRGFDVVGDGNDFERRPLYEVQHVMWKKREG